MTVLQVRELQLARGERAILRGVSLAADKGEILALMGLSGSGKTTILRSIAGLEPFDSGAIDVADVTLVPRMTSNSARRALHQKVGMVFQFHYLFDHLSALENVTLAPVHVQRTRPAAALPRELSGGEAQRVAIARALAVDPPLLLLDEPTASLDPARCSELGATLQQLARDGRTLVMTSHDDEFVEQFASRVVVLAGGKVVESGMPGQVLRASQHPETRRLLSTAAATPPGTPSSRR